MTNPDEGRLLAYLDGELTAGEAESVEAWLREDDGTGRALALEAIRRCAATVTDLLAHLDLPPPTARVRGALPRRAGASRDGRSGSHWLRRSGWAQAAALVLLFAGAGAAAMPGSPVRAFIARALAGEDSRGLVATEDSTSPAAVVEDVGVRVESAAGRLEIVLSGVPDGTPLAVTLVEGELAAVYAPAGTRFQSGDGRIVAAVDATASGASLRVEIPRGTTLASLEVNGRMYLVKDGDRLDLPGPSGDRTETEIRFLTGL
ncbi:MAG TPA: hypothetical protein VGA70_11980 [Longimicrobiales bacterium]|jgi:anti-sigma factor RsiW